MDGQYSVDWAEAYNILECGGCHTLYCQRALYCSEWGDASDSESYYQYSYWPSTTHRQPPGWMDGDIDGDLHAILVELYTAINNDMPILAAIGMRTAFDRATALLGIEPSLRFEEKLDRLKKDGLLGDKDHKVIGTLVDAGSAAAHRGWKPPLERILTMVGILEAFLHKEFVLKAEFEELVSSVPPKKPRTKKE